MAAGGFTKRGEMDGKMLIQEAAEEYKDHGTTICFKGKCDTMRTQAHLFTIPRSGEALKARYRREELERGD